MSDAASEPEAVLVLAPLGRDAEVACEFLPDPTAHGVAPTGFAYVPDAYVAGECDVHIAFHGCRQTETLVGDAFHAEAGYNRWADTNRLIVLYPQATAPPANPNGRWDWWGYDDPRYATRSGRQMAAVRAMLVRVAGDTEAPDRSARSTRRPMSAIGRPVAPGPFVGPAAGFRPPSRRDRGRNRVDLE